MASPAQRYRALRRHPALFSAKSGWARWVHPALLAAIGELRAGNGTALRGLLHEEVAGVYSFELLSDEFCEIFLDELDGYYASGLPVTRPNSMNNYGIIVNSIGMRGALTHLQRHVLHPIAEALYPREAEGGFTSHHSFMVQYRADEVTPPPPLQEQQRAPPPRQQSPQQQDLGLDMHTDDSDVTFNVCLGRNFSGAALAICGDSRTPHHRQFHHSYSHERGRALVHLGSRRHGADDIAEGERNNLIVWNINERHRASPSYVNRRAYLAEAAPPDARCLSYTHDRDYASFRPYPRGKESYRGQGWCPPPHACYYDAMDPVFRRTDHDKEEL